MRFLKEAALSLIKSKQQWCFAFKTMEPFGNGFK